MKYLSFLIGMFLLSHPVFSQSWQRASLNNDGSLWVEHVLAPENHADSKSGLSQISGFPVRFKANPTFKNMRNVALEDMNMDGIKDIIFTADNKLIVYSFEGLLWEKTLSGTVTYPPSIGDVNGNGFPEIVAITTGLSGAGRIYVYDRNGSLLPGWPVNLNNNWLLCAPALSDLNNDGKMEIVVNERVSPLGHVHIFKHDGTSFSANWPVVIDGTPAVTPSIADVDGDGEKDIVIYSTKSRYIFGLDGLPKAGFPQTTAPLQGYSYQSPILADFDDDGTLEITGSTHGDVPQFYSINHDGTPYGLWPHNVQGGSWTYTPPSVVKIGGQWHIFMSRPIGQTPEDMLYGWDNIGNMLPGFPIVKAGGLEGIIAIADITDDNNFELIFGSNLTDNNGFGFIHAYSINGTGELNGFPLRPRGFTFMNGVAIGDVDGNGKMNLVALSYTTNFGAQDDSLYLNIYETDVNYAESKVLWGTYKGHNTRTGYSGATSADIKFTTTEADMILYPNPSGTNSVNLKLRGWQSGTYQIIITDILGRHVQDNVISVYSENLAIHPIDLKHLNQGLYHVRILNDGICRAHKKLIVN